MSQTCDQEDVMKISICAEGDMILIEQGKVKLAISLGERVVKKSGLDFYYVHLAPIGGPVLGPFNSVIEAVKAEMEWFHDKTLVPEFFGSEN